MGSRFRRSTSQRKLECRFVLHGIWLCSSLIYGDGGLKKKKRQLSSEAPRATGLSAAASWCSTTLQNAVAEWGGKKRLGLRVIWPVVLDPRESAERV